MQDQIHSRRKLFTRLILVQAGINVASLVLVIGLIAGTGRLIAGRAAVVELTPGSGWIPALALTVSAAAIVGGLLGWWSSRRVYHRLRRALSISQTWLRGNLSLQIADHTPDELGLLCGRLDLLAEHLRQDERDLDELREYSARLSDQARALAVDEERDRLARELHDGVKQHLFSLAMTTGAIRAHLDTLPDAPIELSQMVSQTESTAKTVQRELTRLIEDLRPASLQEQGLAAALNDYSLLFGAREHILMYVDLQGNDALLPPSVAEALYRVTQEALHNVARHARATRMELALRCMPEQVILTVADNGIGFDVGQPRKGLGLANMQERVVAVSGRLTIDSRVGVGTSIRVEVPLGRPLEAHPKIAPQDTPRPDPTIDNWSWLGQRLVIPVGQTWPWLPADQIHLRRPLVEGGARCVVVRQASGLVGLSRSYDVQIGTGTTSLVRVRCRRGRFQWRHQGAVWSLALVRGPNPRLVLVRNGQALAAMQSQGRLLNSWIEVVYDGRGFSLSRSKLVPDQSILWDEHGEQVLVVLRQTPVQLSLARAVPLPLLMMVSLRSTTGVEPTPAPPQAAQTSV